MAYTISKNHPKYFLLASYHMSPGVENKISTKNYFWGAQSGPRGGGRRTVRFGIVQALWSLYNLQPCSFLQPPLCIE